MTAGDKIQGFSCLCCTPCPISGTVAPVPGSAYVHSRIVRAPRAPMMIGDSFMMKEELEMGTFRRVWDCICCKEMCSVRLHSP